MNALLEKKIDFFLNCHNISNKQFKNLIRFYVLSFQISEEIRASPVNLLRDPNYEIKMNTNYDYFLEKIKTYFNLRIPLEKKIQIDDLIKIDIFNKYFKSTQDLRNYDNSYKAYFIYFSIIETILSEKETLSFKELNTIFEKLFCPIKYASSEHLPIHTLLEEEVNKICKSILMNGINSEDICWH